MCLNLWKRSIVSCGKDYREVESMFFKATAFSHSCLLSLGWDFQSGEKPWEIEKSSQCPWALLESAAGDFLQVQRADYNESPRLLLDFLFFNLQGKQFLCMALLKWLHTSLINTRWKAQFSWISMRAKDVGSSCGSPCCEQCPSPRRAVSPLSSWTIIAVFTCRHFWKQQADILVLIIQIAPLKECLNNETSLKR